MHPRAKPKISSRPLQSSRDRCAGGLLVAVVLLALSGCTAAQGAVTCGSTITKDTTLNQDLVNCSDAGIIIGGDHLTLNLNGHSIGGDGAPVKACPPPGACDIGIDNSAGHANVTIKGGSITQFDIGVLLDGAEKNQLIRLKVSETTSFGFVVRNSGSSTIEHNTLTSTGTSGIDLDKATRTKVIDNSVSGSSGFGIVLAGVEQGLVQQNQVIGNGHGISVQAGSAHDTVRRNLLSHNGSSSIDVGGDGVLDIRVDFNRLINNGDGIIFGDAADSFIDQNVITDTGINVDNPEAGGFGIRLDGSDRNIVSGNTVVGGLGPAILITSDEFPTPAENNVVRGNLGSSIRADGIDVGPNAPHTLVESNFARGSGDDGIDVTDASTTLTGNTAITNKQLGIKTVAGATDGGGNRANSNGNSAQCLNLHCA
jgi:parallel beta-helix repeat protein